LLKSVADKGMRLASCRKSIAELLSVTCHGGSRPTQMNTPALLRHEMVYCMLMSR